MHCIKQSRRRRRRRTMPGCLWWWWWWYARVLDFSATRFTGKRGRCEVWLSYYPSTIWSKIIKFIMLEVLGVETMQWKNFCMLRQSSWVAQHVSHSGRLQWMSYKNVILQWMVGVNEAKSGKWQVVDHHLKSLYSMFPNLLLGPSRFRIDSFSTC